MKIKLSRLKKNILGQTLWIRKSISCNATWFGNSYGGFYINPDLLDENSIIYSIGIGTDTSFDEAIMKQFQCKIYAFDPTPKAIQYVQEKNMSENFIFSPIGIGAKTETATFFLPKNEEHVSGSAILQKNVIEQNAINVNLKTINDIAQQYNHTKIDVLKMDIEGSEYEVIPTILNSNIEIKQILLEFHERLFSNGKQMTKDCIQLLSKHGYKIFAYSDTQEEISFIKNM